MKVEVVPPNPSWREEFSAESKRIALVMGENIEEVRFDKALMTLPATAHEFWNPEPR